MTQETEGTWRKARSFREIPAHWWDYVLDGQMWLVTANAFTWDIPEPDINLQRMLRTRAVYQMGLRQLNDRGLICRNADDTRVTAAAGGVYLQVLPEGVRVGRREVDTTNAQEAPGVGLIWVPRPPAPVVVPIPLRIPDYSHHALQLINEYVGEPVCAADLVLLRHPTLTPFLDLCRCGSNNWRRHPQHCGAYAYYPLLVKSTRDLAVTPEEWFLTHPKRFERRAGASLVLDEN